jgi:peptide/nickel transport system substrate-binding protein
MSTDITELDPRYAVTSNDTKISRLVAAPLVSVDQPTLEPRLELAQAVDAVDPLTWDVTLRPGVRFPDGTEMTSADVVYTFESILDPAQKSFARRTFEERLTRIEALGARRIRFHLKQPLATFRTDLDFGIVSERAARAVGGRWSGGECVGAGAYRVVRLRPGSVELARNPHYVGGAPPIERLVVRTVRDPNTQLISLVGGSADIAQNTVRLDLLADVQAKSDLRVQVGRSAILTYMLFNNEDAILKDVRVRRAMAYALDRELLLRAKFGGYAVLATGLLPPSHWAYTKEVPRYGYDPQAARRLLDEAGYPDPDGPGGRPRFSLTYKTSADPFRVGVARLIAERLGEVGIAVEVRPFEFSTFFADVKKGNFQMATMQTSEIVEPDMYFAYFHSSRIPSKDLPDGGNRWRYRSELADRLMEEGRRTLPRPERHAIYARLQHLLAEDLPVVPLWHEDNVAVTSPVLQGYQVLPNARLSSLAQVHK